MYICLNTLVCVYFNQSIYTVYEDKGPVCLTVVLDTPAPTDIEVTIINKNYNASGKYVCMYIYIQSII